MMAHDSNDSPISSTSTPLVIQSVPRMSDTSDAEALSGVALSWSSASMGAVIALNA
jgi:hypothetical protein